MTKGLFFQALIKFVLGILIIGILLFLPAGTFDYWQAWLLIAILFISMFFAGIVMMLKSPEWISYVAANIFLFTYIALTVADSNA